MIDSLTLALVLVTAPVQRPNMDRVSIIKAPSETALIMVTRRDEKEAEKLTTCYQNEYGSCWNNR